RLVKYTRFLLDNYFPWHDRLCATEGLLMREAALGNADASSALAHISGQCAAFANKFFATL
ncbi:MAG: hypothetical protein RSC43_07060, partial [Clostridia bacterium]